MSDRPHGEASRSAPPYHENPVPAPGHPCGAI